MQRTLRAARRYAWLLAAVLALVWIPGLISAYGEYANTFESSATIWVLSAPQELTQANLDELGNALPQTIATQQADLLNQLLRTTAFVRDVVNKTSLATALAVAPDEGRYLDDIRKRFHVQAPGNNVLTVSFAGRDPHVSAEMVKAALAVRAERVAQARLDATAALNALYQKDYEAAQADALNAQQQIDQFDATHPAPLGDVDQHARAQLRLVLDLSLARLADIRARIDRAALAPAIRDISGMEFQVVDPPTEPRTPSGGTRSALTLAMVAFFAGLFLAAIVVLLGALLPDRAVASAPAETPERLKPDGAPSSESPAALTPARQQRAG
jgi:uncharacterized protein involved in exopolysaccharide biosynthesis